MYLWYLKKKSKLLSKSKNHEKSIKKYKKVQKIYNFLDFVWEKCQKSGKKVKGISCEKYSLLIQNLFTLFTCGKSKRYRKV